MPSACAVYGCYSKPRGESHLRFHMFPQNEELRRKWIDVCQRKDRFKTIHARVCSLHFEPTAYERNLKYELLGLPVPNNQIRLKDGALPTLNLPTSHGQDTSATAKSIKKNGKVEMTDCRKTVQNTLFGNGNGPGNCHAISKMDISNQAVERTKDQSDIKIENHEVEIESHEIKTENLEVKIENDETDEANLMQNNERTVQTPGKTEPRVQKNQAEPNKKLRRLAMAKQNLQEQNNCFIKYVAVPIVFQNVAVVVPVGGALTPPLVGKTHTSAISGSEQAPGIVVANEPFPANGRILACGELSVQHRIRKAQNILYQCSKCGRHFSSKPELDTHVQGHVGSKPIKCAKCGKSFKRNSALKNHLKVHREERPFECAHCGKKFKHTKCFAEHMVDHSGVRPHQCERCGRRYRRKRTLMTHMCVHPGARPLQRAGCDECFGQKGVKSHSGGNLFKCTECERCFTRNANLNNHMKVHTGEKPFCCTERKKRFSCKMTLKMHMKAHTAEKPFKCADCEKGFDKKGSLVRHTKVHTGEKPFKCADCESCFGVKTSLVRHMKVHTREKPYQCAICDKCFANKHSLVDHVRGHTGVKSLQCEKCGKCFSTKGLLALHSRVHSEERPFKCTKCDKCFKHSIHLKSHMIVHSREKPFQCTMCNNRFARKGDLVVHIWKLHVEKQ